MTLLIAIVSHYVYLLSPETRLKNVHMEIDSLADDPEKISLTALVCCGTNYFALQRVSGGTSPVVAKPLVTDMSLFHIQEPTRIDAQVHNYAVSRYNLPR